MVIEVVHYWNMRLLLRSAFIKFEQKLNFEIFRKKLMRNRRYELWKSPLIFPSTNLNLFHCESFARIYRPSFHENKPKTLVFSHSKQAFRLVFAKTGFIISGTWLILAERETGSINLYILHSANNFLIKFRLEFNGCIGRSSFLFYSIFEDSVFFKASNLSLRYFTSVEGARST